MRTPADGLPRLARSAWMRSAAESVTDKACFLAIAVETNARHTPSQISLQPVSEPAQPFCLFSHLCAGDRRGAAEPDAERRRQGSRAQTALLPAAIDQLQQPHPRPPPDVERTN